MELECSPYLSVALRPLSDALGSYAANTQPHETKRGAHIESLREYAARVEVQRIMDAEILEEEIREAFGQ